MRIAQVCMPYYSIPPRTYGGVERMVSYLTEELVRQGQDVTLFASGDSVTAARLIAPCDQAPGEGAEGNVMYTVLLGMVARYASSFDVVHFHLIHWIELPFVRAVHSRALITFHMPIDVRENMAAVFREFGDVPVVTLSDAQRPSDLQMNWGGTIYYGLPLDLYRLQATDKGYLAFIGRINPCKGADEAINIALAAGLPLRIAGPIQDREYFDTFIAPKLIDGYIEYVGVLSDADKQHFLGGASALLFPVKWQEPFGLVMIEAMACGTPVVAYKAGSVQEVVTDGVTGFVVSGPGEAVEAITEIRKLPRARVRAEFERRFSSTRMAADYVHIYDRLTQRRPLAHALA